MNKLIQKELKKRRKTIDRVDLFLKVYDLPKYSLKRICSLIYLALLKIGNEPSQLLCYLGYHKFDLYDFRYSEQEIGRIGFNCDRCGKLITYIALDDMPEDLREYYREKLLHFNSLI